MIRRLTVVLLVATLVGCSAGPFPSSSDGFPVPTPLPLNSGLPTGGGGGPSPSVAHGTLGSPSAQPSVIGVTPRPSAPGTQLPPIPAGAVPILYYHRVEAVPPDFSTWDAARRRSFLGYDVLPAAFAAQLDWLLANGYTTILPRDLAAHWDTGRALPQKPVILTFDDGTPDWVATVLPMLRQRGMIAEFYLTLDAIRPGNLSWSDVSLLVEGGNAIGAHDVHHIQIAGLAGGAAASPEVMWREIHDVIAVIRSHVGTAPDSMAYVGGGYNDRLVKLVQQAGYTTARSIVRGIVQSQADRFTLRVVRIGARDDVLDPVQETLVDGLPTFTARMHGVSDLRP